MNYILLIGFIQGFIFNLYSIFTGKYRTKSFLYINLWVFFLSLNNLQAWLSEREMMFNNFFLDHLHTPWYIFLAPMFYLFLVRYLRLKKKKIILNTLVLFFVFSFLVKLIALFILRDKPVDHLNNYLIYHNYFEESVGFLITVGIFIFSYLIYRKKDDYQLVRSFDSLQWIKTFFLLSLIGLGIWLFCVIHNLVYDNEFTEFFYDILRLYTSFLLYWIAYKSTLQQRLFDERYAIRQARIIRKAPIQKTKDLQKELKYIEEYITQNQSYVDSQLSVEQLADEMEISSAKLSKIINQSSGKNFSDYINSFRVEKAKEMLLNPDFDSYTILSIGLESGFNSKSSFYESFKKNTSLTPTQWRRKNTNNMS